MQLVSGALVLCVLVPEPVCCYSCLLYNCILLCVTL